MNTTTRSLVLVGGAGFGFGLSLLSGLPAAAHGLASTGLAAGFSHSLLGPDHLLLLIGVGAASAAIDAALLSWALAGALLGALFGAFGGSLPLAEGLAGLAVSAVGLLLLQSQRGERSPGLTLAGGVIAATVALHAMLHGQEASGALSWWLGSAAGSLAVVLASAAVVRRSPSRWTMRLAPLLCLGGGLLALAPFG